MAAFAARVWEKRLMWPFEESGEVPPPTSRMTSTIAAASALGFRLISVGQDAKGALYRVRYEFWLPPERDVLLLIGGGRVARLQVDGNWLFTRLADGKCLVTVDDLRASERDLSGLADEAIHPGVPLRVLLERHRGRMAASMAPPLPYSEHDAMAEHREFQERKVATLVQQGYATMVDPFRGAWRFTVRGAFLATVRSYSAGLVASARANSPRGEYER